MDQTSVAVSDHLELDMMRTVDHFLSINAAVPERLLCLASGRVKTLRETGVEPLMTEVIERSHRRTVDAGIAPADGKVPNLDEALKILSEKIVRGR